ncbi:hypothetical protein [Pseudoalteromonas sp. '520P1 No. 423']|uniref:hypothetical protein n=2 Tax=unclassified Pseudoalteromonas TaxID=194690 RepID=UPI000B2E86DA|nr:hypothetical protein [Pseudoalteromonas sp. '520P1 No. 423']
MYFESFQNFKIPNRLIDRIALSFLIFLGISFNSSAEECYSVTPPIEMNGSFSFIENYQGSIFEQDLAFDSFTSFKEASEKISQILMTQENTVTIFASIDARTILDKSCEIKQYFTESHPNLNVSRVNVDNDTYKINNPSNIEISYHNFLQRTKQISLLNTPSALSDAGSSTNKFIPTWITYLNKISLNDYPFYLYNNYLTAKYGRDIGRQKYTAFLLDRNINSLETLKKHIRNRTEKQKLEEEIESYEQIKKEVKGIAKLEIQRQIDKIKAELEFSQNIKGKHDNVLKNCLIKQLGVTELSSAVGALSTANIICKPRMGVAGGGLAGNKTSIVSIIGGQVKIKFPTGVRFQGTNNVIRAGGRAIGHIASRAIPILILYDIHQINRCVRE